MQVHGLIISHHRGLISSHSQLPHSHLWAFLSASCFVLSLWNHHPSPLPDSGGSVYELMVGIKFSSIQFHFSLYRRLVIEHIDSSCQHPLSSLEQFYRNGWQASQFCITLKCTVSLFYIQYLQSYTTLNHTYMIRVWQYSAVKNLIWVSPTSEHDTLSQAVYVRKWMQNNYLRICHFMPSNEHFCPRRLTELQAIYF